MQQGGIEQGEPDPRGRPQRGINRVVVAVWDFEAGQRFYERLLGARFEPENDDGEAAAFGVRVAMAWDAGIELVSPIPGVPSPIRSEMERNGEGVKGVVFAVEDADEAMANARALGLEAYYSLDYTQAQIDAKCAGRFTRYKEHFVTARPPLSGTVLLGEFVERAR
jgi:catechol 2,3-dioxygenase-like lactoylglutathione lyase family enzyme